MAAALHCLLAGFAFVPEVKSSRGTLTKKAQAKTKELSREFN
jgi:hypothetical protein